ncbi:nucleotidyltransferase family protein [uncultured Enterovirga sp.]|uniref:nucleotidyltransferase family protein n=1 Tax=uncultured Enterovirga sp. TaxID=2026352 RepID=UPI0035C9B7DF
MSYPTLTERKRAKVARMEAAVEALAAELAAYAREHGGRFILFGSAARGEMRHDSDVDIMVDSPGGPGSDAWLFAEERAWALGLKPDLSDKGWSGFRLLERVARDGRILDGCPALPDGSSRRRAAIMDARWIDVRQDCEAAARHFRSGARVFDAGSLTSPDDLDRVMTLLHYMQSGHTALESALVRVLEILDEAPPAGSHWHARLITRCATPIPGSRGAILPSNLAADAQDTRAFRHLAMHVYDLTFQPEKATRAIEAGLRLAEAFPARIEAFAREVDPG